MTTLSKTLMILSIALGLTACHPDGQTSSADGDATADHDAGVPSGPASFLGKWQYEAGTSRTSFVCSDGTSFDILADGTESETVTQGIRPNEIVATNDGGCAVTCSVSGQTATCWSGETCDGVTLSADVYTLVGDKLHEVASGSLELDDGTLCQFAAPASVLRRVQ